MYEFLRKGVKHRSRNGPLWLEDVTLLKGGMPHLLKKVNTHSEQK